MMCLIFDCIVLLYWIGLDWDMDLALFYFPLYFDFVSHFSDSTRFEANEPPYRLLDGVPSQWLTALHGRTRYIVLIP